MMTTKKTILAESKRETLVRNLCDFAIKGLIPMLYPEKSIFCERIRKAENGIVCEGESFRYTIITLLGLKRYEQYFTLSPIPIIHIFNKMLNRISTIKNAGDAGLFLWLTAMVEPDKLIEINNILDIANTWPSYQDAAKGLTTELSWLLTGICYTIEKEGKALAMLNDTAVEVFKRIKNNYSKKGLFGHQSGKTIGGAIRGNIGCFADQVYPIYALAKFSETHDEKEALTMARQCSQAICELQGAYGQWWWHYDVTNGKVAGRYPVFSVHQEGMAPMALIAASEKTGENYETCIYKGIDWITGKNELGIDFRDDKRNVIWRNLHRPKWKQRQELLSAMIGMDTIKKDAKDLEILYECRPYNFGWLLYALAEKSGKFRPMITDTQT